MDTEQSHSPLCIALKYVAGACIDENLLDEAETMLLYLEMARIAPRTVGLLHVWTRSQRGDLSEALRRCNELSEQYPEAEEFEPLLAVLRYASGEPSWRAVCERLVASPTASAASKRLANSLLEGTFGKPKQAEAAEPEAPAAVGAASVDAYDFASQGVFMRA
jgi:Bacterial type III secretion protein (HrpB1_HrpK)